MNYEEKVFITGSSGGIGTAITKKFIDIGYKLILISSSKDRHFSPAAFETSVIPQSGCFFLISSLTNFILKTIDSKNINC